MQKHDLTFVLYSRTLCAEVWIPFWTKYVIFFVFKNSAKNLLFLKIFQKKIWKENYCRGHKTCFKQVWKCRGNLRRCSGLPCTCRGWVCHCTHCPPVQTLVKTPKSPKTPPILCRTNFSLTDSLNGCQISTWRNIEWHGRCEWNSSAI